MTWSTTHVCVTWSTTHVCVTWSTTRLCDLINHTCLCDLINHTFVWPDQPHICVTWSTTHVCVTWSTTHVCVTWSTTHLCDLINHTFVWPDQPHICVTWSTTHVCVTWSTTHVCADESATKGGNEWDKVIRPSVDKNRRHSTNTNKSHAVALSKAMLYRKGEVGKRARMAGGGREGQHSESQGKGRVSQMWDLTCASQRYMYWKIHWTYSDGRESLTWRFKPSVDHDDHFRCKRSNLNIMRTGKRVKEVQWDGAWTTGSSQQVTCQQLCYKWLHI